MSKTAKIILVFIVLGVAGYLGYRHLLPSMIAETLTTEQTSSLLPEDLRSSIENVKVNIDRGVRNLPVFMKEYGLGYNDLQIMLDRLQPGQLMNAYEEIRNTGFTTTNEVYDILVRHVRIEGYDLEMFREAFIRNTSVASIRGALDEIAQNELIGSLGLPFAKEMAKKILEDAEPEIRQGLGETDASQ